MVFHHAFHIYVLFESYYHLRIFSVIKKIIYFFIEILILYDTILIMKTKILIIFIFFNLILNTILGVENLDNIISSNYSVYQASDLKLLYGQNTQEKISIASITKLMSAVVAIENINDLNEQIIIDYSLISNNLDPELAVAGIYDGQTLTYYDLLATMLVPSGADSAIYLSEITFNDSDKFIAEMNKKAHELQMNNTNFSNVTGLDDQDNYSTIEDLAKLLKYVLETLDLCGESMYNLTQ